MQRFKKFLIESVEFPGEGEKRKPIVRPSPVTIDPAQRAGELSHDFAAFPEAGDELMKVPDEELIKRFEPYRESYRKKYPSLGRSLDAIESGHPLMSGESWGSSKTKEMAREIRDAIMMNQRELDDPSFMRSAMQLDPTEFGKVRSLVPSGGMQDKKISRMMMDPKIPENFWYVRERPLEVQAPVPHRWRHSHEYRTVEAPKYGRIAQKGADVAGKVSSLIDPISKAAESAAGKILPAAGAVASMYGLADTLFGKEAIAPPTMMDPERQEQEERDELLASAMNPQNNPVSRNAPIELRRAEQRRKTKEYFENK